MKLFFSDEATFLLHNTLNRHNSHYWSDSYPHWENQKFSTHKILTMSGNNWNAH